MSSLKFMLLVIWILVVTSINGQPKYKQLSIKMPGARASKNDDYLCTSVPVDSEEEYIVRFQADASQDVAHHMILSGCRTPGSKEKIWECGVMGGFECSSEQKILFAWAKNAPPKDLPKGVAFKIGRSSGISHLVLQVHYKNKAKEGSKDYSGFILHTTPQRQPYLAGIYLLWAGNADIPPDTNGVHVDLGCTYNDEYPIFAFAYRTHAHGLGKVISGYRIHHKKWSLLGKGDPQAPQAFYSMNRIMNISKGDTVVARCTFDSRGHHLKNHVHVGSTGHDEMCNFYVMYYRDAKITPLREDECSTNDLGISNQFPASSDVALKGSNGDKLTGSRKRILEDEPPPEDSDSTENLEIRMPGAQPDKDNDYLCTSVKVDNKEQYIVHFKPVASSKVAHHMLLFGCTEPGSDKKIWKCGEMGGIECKGGNKIMFAWAKDAPSNGLPKDVGFKIGMETNVKYLVLQMHYKHKIEDGLKDHSGLVLKTTTKRQKNTAGILVIWAGSAQIPPETNGYHVDVGCKYKEDYPMHAFAFRTHAHSLGRVITGYRIHKKHWSLLGRGDPQKPQAFYPMRTPMTITSGDLLVARCTYDTVGRGLKYPVDMGATGNDEMCNFYIMFYRDSKYENQPITKCTQKFHSKNFPANSDAPLKASSAPEDSKDPKSPAKPISPAPSPQSDPKGERPPPMKKPIRYRLVEDWPKLGDLKLGQVTAVSLDSHGNVVVFHRAGRTWDRDSFDDNVFMGVKPIGKHTVVSFDRNTGKIIGQWGRNMFYMPHGLTVDHKDNVWITDVALHQVLKYPPQGGRKPLLTLGKALRPGSDDAHFCQPTDVAVETSGVFYVADGYCNSRILKFKADGTLLGQYGKATERDFDGLPPLGTLDIAHSLALDTRHRHLYVADRENGRVQRLDTSTGRFDREIALEEFGPRVFAVDFNSHDGGVLHVVNGASVFGGRRVSVQGFTVRTSDSSLISKWPGQGNFFTQPHDVASSEDNSEVFVTQIGPNRVWKLSRITYPVNYQVSHPGKPQIQLKDEIPIDREHGGPDRDDNPRKGGQGTKDTPNGGREGVEKSRGGNTKGEVNHKFGGDDGEKGGSQDEWLKALPTLIEKENTNEGPAPDLCKLPKKTGPCRAAFPKWYYSSAQNTCHEFIYGGCEGNANKFDTKQECMEICFTDKRQNSGKDQSDEDVLRKLSNNNQDHAENPHTTPSNSDITLATGSDAPTTKAPTTEVIHDAWDNAGGEDEGPESNIHYNISSYPPYRGKNSNNNGTAAVHKLHKPTQSPGGTAVGMIPALIILSVLAVPIVFLLLISIILRVRAYRRDSRYKSNRLLDGKDVGGLGVSRTRGWCSYLNCCDKRKYGFDKVNLAEFYSDSDSDGV